MNLHGYPFAHLAFPFASFFSHTVGKAAYENLVVYDGNKG